MINCNIAFAQQRWQVAVCTKHNMLSTFISRTCASKMQSADLSSLAIDTLHVYIN